MVIHEHFRLLFPQSTRTDILTSLDRITQPVTDFIRGNPIVSTAAIGIGTTGLIAGVAAFVRKRKKKKVALRRRRRRVTSRRRVSVRRRRALRPRRVTHRSPRHAGHRRVTFKTKTGKTVNFLVRRKTHPHRRRKIRRK